MSVLGSPLSPTSSSGRKHGSDRHTGFWTVREFIRQELAAQKDEKAKSAAKDAHDASVIQAQNDAEKKLDDDRKAYEADRVMETHEIDKRAIQFAKDAYNHGESDCL